MKRAIITLTGVILAWSTVSAQSFNSLYTDFKARQPGDLLTVLIVEVTEAQNQAATETKSEDKTDMGLSAGTGYLGFIPGTDIGGNVNNSFSGSGSSTRKGSLQGKITVKIDSIMPGGLYHISGSRIIEMNKDKQIMQLAGLVRSRDIQSDNTVYSYLIADAQITYTGKGIVASGHNPGILRRILNWIF